MTQTNGHATELSDADASGPTGNFTAQMRTFGGVLLGALLAMLAVEFAGGWAVSGVQAFMHGDELWTHAQKEAVIHLIRYAETGKDSEYERYQAELEKTLGYRAARQAIQDSTLDWERARIGFLRGGSRPREVPKMIILARYFDFVPAIQQSMGIWARGDSLLDEVQVESQAIRAAWAAPPPDREDVRSSIRRVVALDDQLTDAERRFSETIYAWADQLRAIVFGLQAFLALLSLGIGFAFGYRTLQRNRHWKAQLEASEARHRGVVENAQEVIFRTDAEGRWTFLNSAWTTIMGYSVEESLGEVFLDFVHQEDRAGNIEAFRPLLEGEKARCHHEVRYLTKSGNVRWMNVRARILIDDEGSPAGTTGTLADITAQKRAQRRVAREKRLLNATIDSLPGVFSLVTPEGDLRRWNEALETVSGYRADEIAKMEPLDFFDKGDQEHVEATIREGFDDGYATVEANLVAKDGVSTHYFFTVQRLTLEGRPHLVAMGIDISEQIATERALRQSEERWQSLVENHPAPIYITMDGEFAYVNPSGADIFGAEVPEELLGRSIFEFAHPEVRSDLERRAADLNKGLPTEPLEHRIVRLDGKERIVVTQSVPITYQGRPAAQTMVRDVTDRHRYEERLIRAKKRAEEMSRLKTAFLANMSHEIRTPLSSIIGFADVLSEEIEDPHKEPMQIIRRAGRRLLRTLTSVLDLSQLESHTMTFNLEPVDLGEVIGETAILYANEAAEKGVDLKTDVPDEPLVTEIDRGATERILTNLVSNAVKFTEEGYVKIRVRRDGGTAVITVEDTGIGIDKEAQQTIFEEFKQESEGITRKYEGAGLGLAITKRLLELMGGSITVESTKGEGSCFTLCIPIRTSGTEATGAAASADAPTATPETVAPEDAMTSDREDPPNWPNRPNGVSLPEEPEDSKAASDSDEDDPSGTAVAERGPVPQASNRSQVPSGNAPTRILLIEDEEAIRSLLPHLIKEHLSADIDVAEDVDEALDRVEAHPYDLFLIDIHLGSGRSGTDLMHTLRASKAYANAPMVAFTAYALPGDREQFLEAGFDAYLAKPFTGKELLSIIETTLE